MIEAPELLPCLYCGGKEIRIEPCGQTWRGQGYSDPQFYKLIHNGKLPEGDGFETCHIQLRARTVDDIGYMWNTRADLSDAKDKRIKDLEAKLEKAEAYIDSVGNNPFLSIGTRRYARTTLAAIKKEQDDE